MKLSLQIVAKNNFTPFQKRKTLQPKQNTQLSYIPPTPEELKEQKAINDYVEKSAPTLKQSMMAIWNEQRSQVTSADLDNLINYGINTNLSNKISTVYNGNAQEIFSNLFNRSYNRASYTPSTTTPLIYYPAATAAQTYASTYFNEWQQVMSQSQIKTWQTLISRIQNDENYYLNGAYIGTAKTELRTLLQNSIGLNSQQASQNLKLYNTTKETLKTQHPKWAEAKVTAKATEKLEKNTQKLLKYRAETISITESAKLYNHAKHEATKDAQKKNLLGDCVKEVSTAENERTCDKCNALNGEQVPMDAKFSNGSYLPPFHHRCRCVALYREITSPKLDFYDQQIQEQQRQEELLNQQSQYSELNQTEISTESIQEISSTPLTTVGGNDSIKIKEAKTIAEAENYARTELGIPTVSYKGCDVSVANIWNQGLYDTFQRFPALKSKIQFVGECHERNKLIEANVKKLVTAEYVESLPNTKNEVLQVSIQKRVSSIMGQFTISPETIAQSIVGDENPYALNFVGVTINKDYGGDFSGLINKLADEVKEQFHPEGCDTIRSVFDHEIGHQLDALLGIRQFEEVKNELVGRTFDQLTQELSEYAWNNKRALNFKLFSSERCVEMIAEAWAEYCNNVTPRRIATIVGKLIESQYNMKYRE